MEPTTIILGGVALFLLRGKTAEIEPLSQSDLDAMARSVCDVLGDEADVWATPDAIARAVARAAWGPLSWPPMPLATRSHKAAWGQVLEWAREVRARADGRGLTVCAMLRELQLVPAVPVVPPPSGPTLGGVPEVGPGPMLPSPLPSLPLPVQEIRDEPTPGYWYAIKYGDTLLGVAGRAYGLPSGSMRLNRAKLINGAQANAQLRFSEPDTPFEQTHFPAGVLSFMPPYQTIYIPPV